MQRVVFFACVAAGGLLLQACGGAPAVQDEYPARMETPVIIVGDTNPEFVTVRLTATVANSLYLTVAAISPGGKASVLPVKDDANYRLEQLTLRVNNRPQFPEFVGTAYVARMRERCDAGVSFRAFHGTEGLPRRYILSCLQKQIIGGSERDTEVDTVIVFKAKKRVRQVCYHHPPLLRPRCDLRFDRDKQKIVAL